MVETAAADRQLKSSDWVSWPDDKLLDLRMCDLGVTLHKAGLQRCTNLGSSGG